MDLKDRIIVITGAASGIGRAMAQRFAKEAPRLIVCADRDEAGAKATADSIGGLAARVDVSREADIQGLIETIEADHGPIDLFCSNAGIGVAGGAEASNEDWQRIWDINVMAHVWAARHLVPRMAARGGGLGFVVVHGVSFFVVVACCASFRVASSAWKPPPSARISCTWLSRARPARSTARRRWLSTAVSAASTCR